MRDNWRLWERAITPQRCDEIVQMCYDTATLNDATVFSSDDFRPDTSIRDTKVGFVDIPELMDLAKQYIYLANRDAFGFDVDFLPPIQFGEYYTGSYYHYHYDIDWNANSMYDRKLSISIQLTDPTKYEGGDLQFQTIEDPINFRSQGSILVFPSYNVHRVNRKLRKVLEIL